MLEPSKKHFDPLDEAGVVFSDHTAAELFELWGKKWGTERTGRTFRNAGRESAPFQRRLEHDRREYVNSHS